jgi:DNA transformation protein and related proteins
MPGKRMDAAKLSDLPNIGPEVARLLTAAGIHSPRELKNLGSVNAALRIAAIRPDDPPCRSMLAGLEGAIRGIRWHHVPKPQREALWKKYQAQLSPAGTLPKP